MKDNLIKTVQKFLVESANERTRRERLVRFLNHVTGFSGPIKAKYSSSWDHFNGVLKVFLIFKARLMKTALCSH